jgi:hypothetical protein
MERPDQFMVTIINNRADRVSRSKAFAREIVNNLNAHRHFIVGEHPLTFVKFVQEALDENLANLSLPKERTAYERQLRSVRERLSIVSPRDLLVATFGRIGLSEQRCLAIGDAIAADIAQAPNEITDLESARLLATRHTESLRELSTGIRGDIFHDAEGRLAAISTAVSNWENVISEALLFASMSRRCAVLGEGEERDELLRDVVREIVLSHVVVLNKEPSADQMIDAIARAVPVGAQINIMGIQNIRGPGREISEKMAAATAAIQLSTGLNELDHVGKVKTLTAIQGITDWTIPACQEVLRRIYTMNVPGQIDDQQAEVRDLRDSAVGKLNSELARLRNRLAGRRGLYYRLSALFSLSFTLVKPIAMIIWRLRADRTMNDLIAGRISHSKAGAKLKALSASAKGDSSSSSTSESLI